MNRLMKNSGIEWIGEMPANWNIYRIKEQYHITNGSTPRSDVPEFWDGEIVWVTPLDMYDNPTLSDSKKKITKAGYKSCGTTLIPEGSIVVSTRAPIGQISMASVDLCTNQGCKSLSNKNEIDNKFLYYYLIVSTEVLNSLGRGTTFLELSTRDLADFAYVSPAIDHQSRIVQYLDEKCEKIDRLIVLEEEMISELRAYKQSVITEAVTKGLDPNVSMKDTGVKWAVQVPEHWKMIPNKRIMKKVKVIETNFSDEDVLSLTMNGVIIRDLVNPSGKMPTSFDGYQRVRKGNLLMCLFDIDVTPRCIGFIEHDGVTSPAYSQFALLNNNNANYYYYYYLFLDFTKELLHLTRNLRHSFTENQLGDILTPQPPLEEQKEIAEFLDKEFRKVDRLISHKQSKIETLKEYKKSLIYECVTGKRDCTMGRQQDGA